VGCPHLKEVKETFICNVRCLLEGLLLRVNDYRYPESIFHFSSSILSAREMQEESAGVLFLYGLLLYGFVSLH
jgi:hypothetical protein